MVLGIRPDVIRASIMIKELKSKLGADFEFIWSGQHYSDNMRDVFFRQLDVPRPDVILDLEKDSDANMIGSLIGKLGVHLESSRPDAVVFLGDTNTVLGAIAAASLGIPIVHIEGCMRSYDWRMPEEKYRSTIDHLSDVIYAYLPEYKQQGLLEGIREESIVLTGNPIVDVLEHYFLSGKIRMTQTDRQTLFERLGVVPGEFWTMTCHRRENIENRSSLENILGLAEATNRQVIFAAGYRTQRLLKSLGLAVPSNVQVIDPVGYIELLELIAASEGVLSDSGTVVEETAVLSIPTIQMRTSTERPQVYDTGLCLKFDPLESWDREAYMKTISALRSVKQVNPHNLGDGKASTRITNDLLTRLDTKNWPGHSYTHAERPLARNYGNGVDNLAATNLTW